MSGDEPSSAVRVAARILNLDRATAEVVTALRGQGIRSILLKGPSAARWLYDNESERPYVDCDLLVAPLEMTRAEGVLVTLGFQRDGLDTLAANVPKNAVTFRRADAATVDLHHSFFGVGAVDATLWCVLSEHTEPMQIGGSEIEVLTTPARALTIALHAAKDGGRQLHVREDMRHAVERVNANEWEQVVRLAEYLRCLPALSAGLRRVPEGKMLADDLGLTVATTTAVSLRGRQATPLAVGTEWFLTTPGMRRKLHVLIAKLFPPASYLRAWSPLARRGEWGLAAVYAWRPIWMAGRAIPALLAVRRARRFAAGSFVDENRY